jgi:hypothetical protein
MPSPFPGMNPYLEQETVWHDFHQSFIPVARELLTKQVRPQFVVKVEEHLYVEEVPERDSFIAIRERDSHHLVTLIELHSPTSKRRSDRREGPVFERRALLAGAMQRVEIDLLRGGPRVLPSGVPECDYCVIVSHIERPAVKFVWSMQLREPLPHIPIPLSPPHLEAVLDLKEVLDRVYDAAAYGDYIYRGAPHPPLPPADAAWARQFIP